MKKLTIDRIYITSFGKLERVVVDPSQGLDVLCLPNESGKTTYAMFIKFIFYGFVGTRNRTVAENERALYTPWNGENAEGAIELTFGGERYRIDRSVNSQGRDKLGVVDLTTRKNVFVNEVPGEVFFGVGEELFAKTVFFKQLTLPANGDKALAESLRNIAVSADERESADAATKKLAKLQGELTNKQRHGMIHRAEDAASEYSAAFTDACRASERIAEIDALAASNDDKIQRAGNALLQLQNELDNIETYEALQTLMKLSQLQNRCDSAENEYKNACDGFDSEAFAEIGGAGVFMSRHGNYISASAAAESAKQRLAEAEAQSAAADARIPRECANISKNDVDKHKKSFGIMLALALFAALCAVACFIGDLVIPAVIALAVALVFAVLAVKSKTYMSKLAKQCGCATERQLLSLLSDMPSLVADAERAHAELDKAALQTNDCEQKLAEAKKLLDSTISRVVSADSGEEYQQQINRIITLSSHISELKIKYEAAKQEFANESEGKDLDELGAKAKRFAGKKPERDRKQVETEIRFYKTQAEQLKNKNSELYHEREILIVKHGDAALVKGKLDAANARVDELKRFNSALTIAREVLEETSEYIKSSVSPRVSSAASAYFDMLTNGKYSQLNSDTELALTFGDGFASHSSEYLSAGTRECAYIALRLALVDVMYPDISVPMIFDDAFVCIDDQRLPSVLKLLSRLSADRQITVISCSDRETRALDALGLPYSKRELKQC